MGDQARTNEHQGTPKRVLITGGAGFIGSHLAEHLRTFGDEITIIDNLSTGNIENLESIRDEVRFIEANVTDGLVQLSVDEFDEVYHLAAAVGVDLILKDPIGSIRSNIIDTDEVLRFALEHGKARVLIASSSEVYGKPNSTIFSETDDLHLGHTGTTRWSYAHTKAIDEHLAIGYTNMYGLDTVCCRFFNTVGPRQIGRYGMVLPRFVEAAHKGETLRVFGDGSQTRCFCDGRDVAKALPALLRSASREHHVYNLGSDQPIAINELAELVISTLDSDSSIEHIEYEQAYQSGFEDLRHRKPNLERIRSAIGFSPAFTLTETIQDLHQTMLSSQLLGGSNA